MVDGGSLGGSTITPRRISADGSVIVGYGDIVGDIASHAFIYSGGTLTDIGTLGGPISAALAVTPDGSVVVGMAWTATDAHPFSYYGGVMHDLGSFGGSTSSALGVSDDGSVIVGLSYLTGDTTQHAFSYYSGTMHDLGTLGGTHSSSYGVSADGSTVFGFSQLAGDATSVAFSYYGGVMHNLGSLGGSYANALFASSDGSVIVGASDVGGQNHVFTYSSGTMSDIGTLGGSTATARGLSADGSVIVGYSDITGDTATHAYYYTGGAMTDIGTLGGTSSVASGVSADGTIIVGQSQITGDTAAHAFVYYHYLIDINATASAVSTTAAQARGLADMRMASLTAMTNYDCPVFGGNKVCMALAGRYAAQSGSFGETAGTAIIAMRLSDKARGGLFIDYADSTDNPAGMRNKDNLPTFGGFLAYQATPGAGGFELKVSGGYQRGKLAITRDALAFTEAGKGEANTSAYFLNAEWAYGLPFDQMMLTPYVAIRYANVTRDAYSEDATATVTFPITYDKFSQKLTTAVLGGRGTIALTDTLSARAGLGVEYDIDEQADNFSGTSAIPLMTRFSMAGQNPRHRTRGFGSAGLDYQLSATQSLSFTLAARQRMSGSGMSAAAQISYAIGF